MVELKVGHFQAGYICQLGTYVPMVDDLVRDDTLHAPTVGILLVADRNEQIVRYALSGSPTPLAVTDHTYDNLPPETRAALPDSAQLRALLDQTVHELTTDDGLIEDLPDPDGEGPPDQPTGGH